MTTTMVETAARDYERLVIDRYREVWFHTSENEWVLHTWIEGLRGWQAHAIRIPNQAGDTNKSIRDMWLSSELQAA